MPRYSYDRLCVSSYHVKEFDPRHPGSLKAAVEYLKTIEDGKFTGLLVEVSVQAGPYKLRAPAFLKLHQILGKRPAEVWELLYRQIDSQIKYFEAKSRGWVAVQIS